MTQKLVKAVESRNFDGVANKTTFLEIINNLFNGGRIDLFPRERIIKINIRWGELYCECNEREWSELYKILKDHNIKIKKKLF